LTIFAEKVSDNELFKRWPLCFIFKEVILSLPFQLKAIINSFRKTFEAKGLPHAKPEKSAKLSASCKGCLFKSVFHLAKGR
jgi:hypothetical protein